MKSKKAVVEVQINWIFVLIAGALILLLFVSFVMKQKSVSTIKLDAAIKKDISLILTGSKVSSGTTNIIEIPQTEISFACEQGAASYEVGTSHVPKQTNTLIIFGPSNLKTNKLLTWAIDWNVPFKVTEFLYITSPYVRYIFVAPSGMKSGAKDKFARLPEEMTIDEEIYITGTSSTEPTVEDIRKKNHRQVRFVFFETLPRDVVAEKFKSMEDDAVTALSVAGNKVFFYKKELDKWGPAEESRFFDDTTLYGAVFVDNKETYECMLKKAFVRLSLITGIHQERAGLLKLYTEGTPCKDHLEDGEAVFSSLLTSSNICKNDLSACSQNIVSIGELSDYNLKLQQRSCPLLY